MEDEARQSGTKPSPLLAIFAAASAAFFAWICWRLTYIFVRMPIDRWSLPLAIAVALLTVTGALIFIRLSYLFAAGRFDRRSRTIGAVPIALASTGAVFCGCWILVLTLPASGTYAGTATGIALMYGGALGLRQVGRIVRGIADK